MKRPPGRWLRVTAIGAAALYALYLLVGNALLNSGYGRALANRMPEKFVASWGSAWTLYPGHLQARDVRMAGHVRHVVWSVQADAVRGRLALLPLLARELRFPAVLATAASGGASRIDLERLPPAPRPGGWTLRLDSITVASVRHAHFNRLVLLGDGRATGGFVKTLRGGPLEVLPSTLEFREGAIFQDGERLAWDSRIESRLAIARHLREEAPGIRKLEKTELDIDIEATTAGLRLEHDAARRPVLGLSRGPGRLVGRLGWNRGALVTGGTLSLSFPASGDLDGTVEHTEATLEAEVTDDDIRIRGGLAPIGSGSISAATDLAIRGRDIPLQDPASLVRRTSGRFFTRWHFESLAWLADLLPGPKIVNFDGAGTAIVDLKFHDGQPDAGSSIEIPSVAATAVALGSRFDGNARAKITLEPARTGELQPRLLATMTQFRVAPADAPDQPYVRGQDLQIEATSRGDATTLDDHVRARLRFKDALVPDMRTYNRYLPDSGLRFVGGAGRLSGDLQFDREGNVGRGNHLVNGKGVQLALADLMMQGDVVVDTRLRRTDLAAHRFNIDGSRLSLRGVRVTRGEEQVGSDWWARIALERARLVWQGPPEIEASIRAQTRDASVLLALFAQRKHLPAWAGKVVDAGEVHADGRLRLRRGTLLLDPFDASNERFDVLARMRLERKQATGDLFVRWGALAAGVELAPGRRQVHLVGARRWFDDRPGLAAP